MKKVWYAYMSGDPFNVKSYTRLTIKPGYLCGKTICAVYVEDTGSIPDSPFSKNIISYIKRGLATERMQPWDPYYVKKYVYLKY